PVKPLPLGALASFPAGILAAIPPAFKTRRQGCQRSQVLFERLAFPLDSVSNLRVFDFAFLHEINDAVFLYATSRTGSAQHSHAQAHPELGITPRRDFLTHTPDGRDCSTEVERCRSRRCWRRRSVFRDR